MKVPKWLFILTLTALVPSLATALTIRFTEDPDDAKAMERQTFDARIIPGAGFNFPGASDTFRVLLLEPGSPREFGRRIISDKVKLDLAQAGNGMILISAEFNSEIEGTPLSDENNPGLIFERGGIEQDITVGFQDMDGLALTHPNDFHVFVTSDADVPVPGTLALFGLGIMIIAGLRRYSRVRYTGAPA